MATEKINGFSDLELKIPDPSGPPPEQPVAQRAVELRPQDLAMLINMAMLGRDTLWKMLTSGNIPHEDVLAVQTTLRKGDVVLEKVKGGFHSTQEENDDV